MTRIWTPKELLEREELAEGERVTVDGPRRVEIQRVGGGKLLFPDNVWARGLYYAVHHRPDQLMAHYLHPDGTWHLSTERIEARVDSDGIPINVDPRTRYPGFFDSLPELLDALYVARQREAVASDVATLVERIDRAMLDGYKGGTFAYNAPRDPAVEREIVGIYGARGWSVKRVSDQRDGDYLEFRVIEWGDRT